MRHLGSLRIFESVVRLLADESHEILILAHRRDDAELGSTPETMFADLPQIHWSWEDAQPDGWTDVAGTVRIWLDYLRYFEPSYANAPHFLRAKVGTRVPGLCRRITGWPLVRSGVGRRVLGACLRGVERALPRQAAIDAVMRAYRPDVVLVTPLVRLGSNQVEVLRSARVCGARTALCVASWDHLTNKARISELPDRVFVWNDTQKREAVDLHGVPADRVVMTGAQCFDQWFDRVPIRPRDEFLARAALPAARPFLLFVCSSFDLGGPIEAHFVRDWVREIRASHDPALRSVGILIRPHPTRLDEWRGVDLSEFQDVALFGSSPIDETAKEEYFESLYHSAVVVGLNTSAFLEAAIVGRPVHTIIVPEFSQQQSETIHFNYLLSVGGGVLRSARDFDEHRTQLLASLREPPRTDLNAEFVEAFIRPHGLRTPATPLFGDAVGELFRSPAPAPLPAPFWVMPFQWVVRPTFALLLRMSQSEMFRGDWNRKERERGRREVDRKRVLQDRQLAAEAKERERAQARAAKAARETVAMARKAERQGVQAEKAARKRLREREKAARSREKRRVALRGRLKRGASRWLGRWRPGQEGQAP